MLSLLWAGLGPSIGLNSVQYEPQRETPGCPCLGGARQEWVGAWRMGLGRLGWEEANVARSSFCLSRHLRNAKQSFRDEGDIF